MGSLGTNSLAHAGINRANRRLQPDAPDRDRGDAPRAWSRTVQPEITRMNVTVFVTSGDPASPPVSVVLIGG